MIFPSFSDAFLWHLPVGKCVGFFLPSNGFSDDEIASHLSPAEAAFAKRLHGFRQTTWIGGRLAIRALVPHSESHNFLPNEHNAPILPSGWTGSISHKNNLAVAWAAPQQGSWQLGVDLESTQAPRFDIAPKVLTPRELKQLQLCTAERQSTNLMIQFSAKEAIYKAIHPFVRRYVRFQEVEVHVQPDDTLRAEFALPEGPFESELFLRRFNEFVVTFARIRKGAAAQKTQPMTESPF